ncbi:MAG: glycosyltransferase [Anaerolineaceae bacterium]|nr:glycosyltransferase [Anaerolineaceae bacterium]
MTPLVSVIIPCYEQARFVAAAVASALSQTYPQVEVIVVDDGSTDDPETVLAAYSSSISLIQQQNRGLAAARNAGFHHAQGEYLFFLDSDDQLFPDALARHVALLEDHPDYALSYSAWQQVSEDGREVYGIVRPNISGHVLEPLLLRRFFFFASSTLVRRACLEQVGLFDESILWGEDADLWTRLAYAGFAFGYLDEPLTRYRIHAKSMTAQVSLEQSASWTGLLDKFFATPNLPEHLLALKGEAYAVLHYETAGRCYRAGQTELAEDHLKAALALYPQVQAEWLLEWVAGTALDSRTTRPEAFMRWVSAILKGQGQDLGRRLPGRYHTAAIFAAYQSRRFDRIRAHIIPALLADPAVLRNRGFLRIALESFVR